MVEKDRKKQRPILSNLKLTCFPFTIKNLFFHSTYPEVVSNKRARSTDRDKLTANKLTTNQRFRHSNLVTDFVTKEGLGKIALGIVKYAYDRSSQLIGVI